MKSKVLMLLLLVPMYAYSADWQGFYLGGLVGQSKINPTWTTNSAVLLDPTFVTGSGFDRNTATQSYDYNAISPGLIFGYNSLVRDNFLIGLETEFDYLNKGNTKSNIPGIVYSGNYGDSITINTKWNLSIKGRLGYLLTPNTMFYGVGGVSAMNTQASIYCSINGQCGDATHQESYSKNMIGWTAGAGLESFLTENISMRLEWRYADYGSFQHTYLPVSAYDDVTSTVKLKSSTSNLMLVYKF